jgi:dihydroorotase
MPHDPSAVPTGGAFDLVVHGGTLVDPATGARRMADVGVIGDRVAAIGPDLPLERAGDRVDARGALVLPGLVDGHAHVYWGGTPLGIDPDAFAGASGVTAWLDTGSAGAGNVDGLVHHVIERTALTIKAFVHLSYVGLVPAGHTDLRFGELFDMRLGDVRACLRAIEAHAQHTVGVKVRLGANATGPNGMDALRAARAVADASGKRLMIHIADPPPLLEDALPYLREGDLVTHCYTPGLMGILDRQGRVRDAVREARARGVWFDVGHGAGSFSFDVARRALDQGFGPDVISSDLHAYNVDGPVFDLPTTLTKFLALGMPLDEVLRRATTVPGSLFGGGIGTLEVGGRADVAVVRLAPGPVVLGDARSKLLEHHERLAVVATVLAGRRLTATYPDRQGKRKPGLPPIDPRLTRPGDPPPNPSA